MINVYGRFCCQGSYSSIVYSLDWLLWRSTVFTEIRFSVSLYRSGRQGGDVDLNSRASDASSPATQSSSVDYSPSRLADSSVTNTDKGTLNVTANGRLPDKKPQSLSVSGGNRVRYDADSPAKASDSTSSSPDRMVSFSICIQYIHTSCILMMWRLETLGSVKQNWRESSSCSVFFAQQKS